jgi:putative ABC transport system permease protein
MPIEGQRFTVLIGVEGEKDGVASFTFEREKVYGAPIRNEDECSLGVIAARQLRRQIGDRIRIGDRDFRVVSTFSTGVVIYDAAVCIELSALQRMLGREGRVTAFFVDLRDGANPESTAARLEAANPGIVAISGASQYKKVDIGLETAEAIVRGVTLAAIIIGSIVVLNTMWMTVLERTREIGLLRAVGWSSAGVIRLVLIESILAGLIALAVGSSLGVLLAELIARAPPASQLFRPVYAPGQFAVAAAATLALSVLGGALPAWRAAHISPAEALRYE